MPVLDSSNAAEVALLQGALDGAGIGVWEYDVGTELAKVDFRMAEMFGLSDEERRATPLQRFLDAIHDDDVEGVAAGIVPHQPFDMSYRISHNGLARWVRSVGRWGEREGATLLLGVTVDITEERKRQERLELLAQEMRHRVGNTFAILGGLVSMEAPEADTAAELADKLRDRLANLSRAQSLILRDGKIEPERSLSGLLNAVAKPFLTQARGRFDAKGPDVTLEEEASNALGMVFYEWLTNALKYGAFSDQTGTITVQWQVDEIGLSLTWIERKDHGESTEGAAGFGEKMQQTALAPLGGVVERVWADGSIQLTLRMPLTAASATDC